MTFGAHFYFLLSVGFVCFRFGTEDSPLRVARLIEGFRLEHEHEIEHEIEYEYYFRIQTSQVLRAVSSCCC